MKMSRAVVVVVVVVLVVVVVMVVVVMVLLFLSLVFLHHRGCENGGIHSTLNLFFGKY